MKLVPKSGMSSIRPLKKIVTYEINNCSYAASAILFHSI